MNKEDKQENTRLGFIILIIIIVCISIGVLYIVDSLEAKALAAQGLQQCYSDGHILWQKECNNGGV